MLRDPICGIAVDPDATPPDLKMTIGNEVYAFCSIRCRLIFEEEKLPFLLRTKTPRLAESLRGRRTAAAVRGQSPSGFAKRPTRKRRRKAS